MKIYFSCKEPKPPYAEELIHELQRKVGGTHRGHFVESSPVSVVRHVESADAVVTFYNHSESNDAGLDYDVMIPGAPELGGWFCDDDKYYGGPA